MTPGRIPGLASVAIVATGLSGCAEPIRNDGHMFERWADAVAAIPIDSPVASTPGAQTTPPRSPLKIDLIDHLNGPNSRALGLRSAVDLVDSELAGLRRHVEADHPEPAPGATQVARRYVARLAAYPNPQAAQTAWEKLQASHPRALAGLKAQFESVDLGPRGVWTRLRTEPLPSREAAEAVCAGAGVADRWCVAPRSS